MHFEKVRYEPLLRQEHENCFNLEAPQHPRRDISAAWKRFIVLLIMITGTSLGFGLGFWAAGRSCSVDTAWRRLNVASPIADEIHLTAEWHELDGSITGQEGNIFLQDPSPAVDAAWANLSAHNHVWVGGLDLDRIGKDPEVSLKVPDSYGLGPDAYVAAVDFGHKIHCLNRIRKEVHFDHYYKSFFPDGRPSALHTSHVNHCLYILLQSLMCEASTDISPFTWYQDSTEAFQDFVINRKCGNFDGVYRWAAEHQLPGIPQDIEKPAGQKTAGPMDEKLLELLSQHDA